MERWRPVVAVLEGAEVPDVDEIRHPAPPSRSTTRQSTRVVRFVEPDQTLRRHATPSLGQARAVLSSSSLLMLRILRSPCGIDGGGDAVSKLIGWTRTNLRERKMVFESGAAGVAGPLVWIVGSFKRPGNETVQDYSMVLPGERA